MFERLGINWAGSLLGFLGIAFLPIPFLFYIYGPALRRMSKHAPSYPPPNQSRNDEETGSNEEEDKDGKSE